MTLAEALAVLGLIVLFAGVVLVVAMIVSRRTT